jgi:hypothetical protein
MRHDLSLLRRIVLIVMVCAGAVLVGCATPPDAPHPVEADPDASPPVVQVQPVVVGTPWATASRELGDISLWRHFKLPGKQATKFVAARLDGRDTMAVTAVSSASMLRKTVRIEPAALGAVNFSWKVPGLIANADMALRDQDDSVVRIVLAFDGDRSRFSPKNAMMAEMARLLTGEEMPYATLMYVWCNDRPPGTVIVNPRTDRIRKLVVESGPRHLGQWMDYQRDVRADFKQAFGEDPGALIAIGIMTDSDNTRSTVKAWYGPVRMVPAVAARD